MSALPDNHPQTHANPVEGGTPEVIQCLVDWLEQNGPNEQKAHRILSALAQESLKKATRGKDQRRFTAEEITAAAGEEPWAHEKKPNEWLDWKGTVETYWNAKKSGVIQFAVKRGLKHYPRPHRNSTSGKHKATYEIVAEPIPENGVEPETAVLPATTPTGPSVDTGGIQYEVSEPGEVNLTWWIRPFLRRGEFRLSGWRSWLILCWIVGVVAGTTLIVLAAYLALMAPRPITTKDLAGLIGMVALPAWAWFDVIKPWFRLLEDRIKPASTSILALKEKPAQIEVFRDNDLRVIRFVRYSGTCSVCGASVYLDDGSPDFPRRLVGRCSESPREHVFSFDRVTRRGAVLRRPPAPQAY
jgi:hypothetical protein